MHTQRRHIVRSTMDVLESRRLLASVTGTVFSDTDADGRLDAGEAGLAGRTVFADYNYNRRFDAGDVSATTDANGNYTLTSSRTTGISLLVTLNSGELVSLPYGASDLWIPTISGPGVSGKNIGIRLGTPPPATTRVVGYYYIDANHNTRRDAGETGPSFSAGVYVDLNDNRQFDAGEPNATPRASDGRYLITDVPVGVYVIVRPLSISTQDGQPRIFTEPSGWNIPHYSAFSADGNTLGDWNFGVEEANVGRIYISAFTDLDRNGVNNDYESEAGTFWYDAVPNGVHDDYEPFFTATQPALGDPKPHLNYYLDVPYFTFRIAGQRAGDRDNVADLVQMVTVSATNRIAPASFVFSSPGTVLRGVVYNDLNRNGGRDPGESFRNHVSIFADYNDNRLFDSATETLVYTDISGKYAFEVGDRGGTLRLYDPTNQFILTGPAVEGYRFAPSGTIPDLIGGLDFGVVLAASSTVTGTVFADADRDGRLDAGETGLANRTVFADYNYNGRFDAGEASAITDATGLYSINTRASQVSLRLLLNAGETVSLPYGAASLWLSSVNGTVSGANLGIIAPSAAQVWFGFFADHDRDGARDAGEPLGLGAPSGFSGWLDLDGNATQNLAAGEISIERDTLTGGAEVFSIVVPTGTRTFQVRSSNTAFTSGSSITVHVGPAGTVAAVGIPSDVVPVDITLFDDRNGNGVWDQAAGEMQFSENDAFFQTHVIFLDANGDGILQSDREATVWTSHYSGNHPKFLLPGTYILVGLLAGERFTTPNSIVVTSAGGSFNVGIGTTQVHSVTGTVFADANRDGRLDVGESRLAGRTVFADYNYNGRLDAGEASAITDATGLYSINTRSTQVSLRLLLNAGETVSLPYGATSIWLSSVSGIVTGKNLGVIAAGPATTVLSGFVYLDSNGNGRRDPGELPPYGVSIAATVNGSPIIGTLSESTGEYRFPDVPVGATATMTISFVNDDSTVSYLLVEPNFTSPQRTIVAQAVPQTAAGDFRLTDSFNRIISVAFKDLDQDNVRDLYDPDIGLADRWLDVNANGLHDAGDLPLLGSPTYANNNTRPYAYLNVPAGTWRIAMRRAGDTDLIADEIKVVTFSGVNQTGNAFFVSQPTLPVVSGVVFSDDNGNGVQDAGEGGLSTFRSFGIFVDYNDNYYQDANEPDVQSEFDGSFFFESAQAGTVYVDMSASLKAQTFPAPATMGQRFDPAANQVSGLRFGYRDQSSGWVNGSVFIDVNHNGRRDADDLDAAGRLVYADYNFNGRFDASEAAAYTDQFGSYHLATRGTNLNIRVALEPGEIVSLPYGASSLWIPNVDASVYGKNIGLVFTQHG